MVMKMKKKSRFFATFMLLAIMVVSFAACSGAGGDIISNADFEKGSGSSINGWKLYNYHKDYEGDSSRTKISLVDMGFDGKCVKIERLKNIISIIFFENIIKPTDKTNVVQK